jgi:hypothetical protein
MELRGKPLEYFEYSPMFLESAVTASDILEIVRAINKLEDAVNMIARRLA